MRPIGAVAVIGAVVGSAAWAPAAVASEPAVVGSVSTAGGTPAREGVARLLLDTSGDGRRTGFMPVVASAPIAAGKFVLRVPAARVAGATDASGWRSFVVLVRSGAQTGFRAVAQAPASGAHAASAAAPAARVHITTTPVASAASARAQGGVAQGCRYHVERTYLKRVQMTELHSWPSITASFTYAQEHSADSLLGAAFQGPGGHWGAGGVEHVTKASTFGEEAFLSRRLARRLTGRFRFNTLKLGASNCGPYLRRFTKVVSFVNEMRIEKRHPAPRGLSGRCNTSPGRERLWPHVRAFTERARGKFTEHTFSLYGISLGSGSGWSKNADVAMVNHGPRVIWICGSAQGGRGVPFRAGAMVYAGPARR